jgi:hypothetical protein
MIKDMIPDLALVVPFDVLVKFKQFHETKLWREKKMLPYMPRRDGLYGCSNTAQAMRMPRVCSMNHAGKFFKLYKSGIRRQ